MGSRRAKDGVFGFQAFGHGVGRRKLEPAWRAPGWGPFGDHLNLVEVLIAYWLRFFGSLISGSRQWLRVGYAGPQDRDEALKVEMSRLSVPGAGPHVMSIELGNVMPTF